MFNALVEYLKLAIRSLVRRKLRSWLTMIGIFIGIAAVVSLIGLGEGLRTAIVGQFGSLGPDVLQIQASGMNMMGPPGTAVPNPLTKDLVDKIKKVNGVDSVFPRYIATGSLDFNGFRGIGFAISMPSGEERKKLEEMSNLKVRDGRLLKDGDARKAVIGYSLGKSDSGFGRAIKVGDKVLLNQISYDVVGILESKGSYIYDSAVYVNEDYLLKDLRSKGDEKVNIIAVKVKDISLVEKAKSDIEKVLRKERNVKLGEEDFTVESSQKTLESLNSSLFAVQLFVYIIASISLIVGGIGIMNTMYTSVLERTKEIGVLKSIGAKNRVIFFLFALESGFLGLIGGIIGVMLGLGIAYGFAYLGQMFLGSNLIQVTISLFLIIGSLLFSFIIGIMAGVLPAIRASKMHPVDALRYAR